MKKRKHYNENTIAQRKQWVKLSIVSGIAAILVTYFSAERCDPKHFTFFCLPAIAVLLCIMFYSFKKIRHLDRKINSGKSF